MNSSKGWKTYHDGMMLADWVVDVDSPLQHLPRKQRESENEKEEDGHKDSFKIGRMFVWLG